MGAILLMMSSGGNFELQKTNDDDDGFSNVEKSLQFDFLFEKESSYI